MSDLWETSSTMGGIEMYLDKRRVYLELEVDAQDKTIQRLRDEQEQRIKNTAIEFFFWWYNREGTNTYEGFDTFWQENKERIMSEPLQEQDNGTS